MSSVLEGQGISWLKHSRVKKLLEDENYRNFVVSRLNRNLDKKLTDEDHHIEDVVSDVIRVSLRENLSSGFPTKQVSNQSPQHQRLARILKFRLKQA